MPSDALVDDDVTESRRRADAEHPVDELDAGRQLDHALEVDDQGRVQRPLAQADE